MPTITSIPAVQGWWADPAPLIGGSVIAPSPTVVLVEALAATTTATSVNAATVAPGPVAIGVDALSGRVRFGPIARGPAPVAVVVEAFAGSVSVNAAVTAPVAVDVAVGAVAGRATVGTVVHASVGVPITVEALPAVVVSSRNATVTAPASVTVDVTAFAAQAVASTKAAPEGANPSGAWKAAGDSTPLVFSHTKSVQDGAITHYLVAINTIDYAASWDTPVVKVGSTTLSLISTSQFNVAIGGSVGHLFIYQMDNPPQGTITFNITTVTSPEIRAAAIGFTNATDVTVNDTFSGVASTPRNNYYGPTYPTAAQADCAFVAYAAGASIGNVGRAGGQKIIVNGPTNNNSILSLVAASVTSEELAAVQGEFTYLTFNPLNQTNNAYCITMINVKN